MIQSLLRLPGFGKAIVHSFWTILILLFFSFSASAQQSTLVTGRVVRASNGEPLAGASIFIKGSTRGTITDQMGRYQLTISRPVELVGRFIGFLDVTQVAVPGDNQQITVNFRLTSNDMQLRDAVVSANRIDEYLQKVPVAASVIANRDLEQRSVYNTLESLNNVPNLISDSWLNSQPSFSIRGLSTVFDNVGFESTLASVSYTHITLQTKAERCRSRWTPKH